MILAITKQKNNSNWCNLLEKKMMSPISIHQLQTNNMTYFNKPITNRWYLLFKKNNDFTYLEKNKSQSLFHILQKTNRNQMMSPISKIQTQTNDFAYFIRTTTNKWWRVFQKTNRKHDCTYFERPITNKYHLFQTTANWTNSFDQAFRTDFKSIKTYDFSFTFHFKFYWEMDMHAYLH